MLDKERMVQVLAFEAENRRSMVARDLASIIERLQEAQRRLNGEAPFNADLNHHVVRMVADAAERLTEYKVYANQLALVQNGSYDQK